MIIGNHAVIERNLQAGSLMAGESVHVTGKIVSDDDIRADVWCKFDSEVIGGGDAYLGEFTVIGGKITVEGDLDIGKEVKLNGGFLSKGWIVVRNPLPIMVFIFLYIRELMRLGKTSDEIDKTLGELFEDDEEIDLEKLNDANMSDILNRGGFFVIPIGSKISPESINVPEDTIIGNNCVINTNLICKRFEGGKNLTFDGVLRSKGETIIDDGSRISGEINVSGKLIIGKDVKIKGTVSAKSVIIHETSFMEGNISFGSVRFVKGDGFDVKDYQNKEKAELLSKSNSFDLINTNITETKDAETQDDDETETYSTTEGAVSEPEAGEMTETDSETETETGTEKPLAERDRDTVAPDDENDVTVESDDKKTGGARAKRRSARKEKQRQLNKVEIFDVFTGENMETAKPEPETSENEEAVSKEEETVSEEEEPVQKEEEAISKEEETVSNEEEPAPKMKKGRRVRSKDEAKNDK
ncbi:MAG: hypothetical protein FWE54_02940 [Methanimicrococcus sp.]|nr:hypothetical protein [Methanimicrococcus sp.]